jgi:hypothetical protein
MRQSFLFLLTMILACCAFAQGVTKNGQVTSTASSYVSTNGGIGAGTGVDVNGKLLAGLSIGSDYQGGKIFYFFVSGDPGYVAGQTHGLIAAATDLPDAVWDCDGTDIAGTRPEIGYGQANTNLIRAACPAAGGAAELCANLVSNSYSDWYLPSIDELIQLANNQGVVGGFAAAPYFSSTQYASSSSYNRSHFAMLVAFYNNTSSFNSKITAMPIRAIRTF